MLDNWIKNFIKESNSIENINRDDFITFFRKRF